MDYGVQCPGCDGFKNRINPIDEKNETTLKSNLDPVSSKGSTGNYKAAFAIQL